MTARLYIAVTVALALFIGAIALAGYIGEHVPTALAFAFVLTLVVLVLAREEGRS